MKQSTIVLVLASISSLILLADLFVWGGEPQRMPVETPRPTPEPEPEPEPLANPPPVPPATKPLQLDTDRHRHVHIVAIGDSLTAGAYWGNRMKKLMYAPYLNVAAEQLLGAHQGLGQVTYEHHGFPGKTTGAILHQMKNRWGVDGGEFVTNRSNTDELVVFCVVMSGTNDALFTKPAVTAAISRIAGIQELCTRNIRRMKDKPTGVAPAMMARTVRVVAVSAVIPPMRQDAAIMNHVKEQAMSAGKRLKESNMGYCSSLGQAEVSIRDKLNAAIVTELPRALLEHTSSIRGVRWSLFPRPVNYADVLPIAHDPPLWSDCLHPNAAGYRKMGVHLGKILSEWLSSFH